MSKSQSEFQKNWALKLLSLAFAIVFWIYVMDQVNPETTKSFSHVQVEITNLEYLSDEKLVVSDETEFFADVRIKGRRSDVLKVGIEDIKLYALIDRFSEGVQSLEIEKKIYQEGVTIDNLSVNEIEINLEKTIQATKPIHVKYTGTLSEGMTADQAKPNITSVEINGPRSKVNRVARVEGVIDLSALSDSKKVKMDLIPVDSYGQEVEGIKLIVDQVDTEINVYKVREVPLIIQQSIKAALGYKLVSIIPEFSTVGFKEDGITPVPEKMMTNEIILNNISKSQTIDVDLIGDKVLLDQLEATVVKVTITVEKLETREFIVNSDSVEIVNIPTGTKASLITPSEGILVKITDVPSNLNRIKEGSLSLNIDGTSLVIGEHDLIPKLNLSFDAEKVQIIPAKLHITILNNQ